MEKNRKKVLDFSVRQTKTTAILQLVCDNVMHMDSERGRTAKRYHTEDVKPDE